MKAKVSLVLIIIIFCLCLSNTIYSKEAIESKEYQQDVLYPPESALARQGLTLESYKQSLVDNAPRNRNSSVDNIWGTSPLSGNIRIPVLLVQFSDNMPTLSAPDINAAFNDPNYLGGNGISVSKYYTKQSYGDLNITFDVYGWQTAPQTFSYYSQNNNTNFQMELDTLNLFNSIIDYSIYDNDGSGRIDGFVIIYPGPIGSAPTGIWPHARIMRNWTSNTIDGKYFGNIAAIPELGYSGDQFEIPVTTHEFAHVLGLFDLYSLGPNYSGPGPIYDFTMMNFNFDPSCLDKPINLDAWSRYFFGWTNPMILTTDSSKEISLRSANDYPDSVILKNSNMTSREFFIIENRYRNTSDPNNLDNCMFNNGSLLHGGFAIYHVDENKIEYDYPNNYVNWDPDDNWWNDTVSHPGIMCEQNRIFNYTELPNQSDLYYNGNVSGCDYAYFDENFHACLTMIFDATTRAYSGVLNPLIRFEALSPSQQPIMFAKMLVGEETLTPTATPNSGNYSSSVSITLNTETTGATIYYTLDGSTPTTTSNIYSSPITLTETTTLKAIAKKDNFYVSDVLTENYTISLTVETPNASVPGGNYNSSQTIELTSPTTNSIIRYTLDGTEPNRINSLYYNGAITISSNTTLKAKAFLYIGPASGLSSSNSSKSSSTSLLTLGNFTPTNISWLYSPTLTEQYVFARKTKPKVSSSIPRDNTAFTNDK